VHLLAGEQQRAAIAEDVERAAEPDQAEAMPLEIEVADDLRPQQAEHIGGDRVAVSGVKLLRHSRAADHRPALQYERTKAAPTKISRRRQAVMPAADDDGVVPVIWNRQLETLSPIPMVRY